jgi:hypothetical protein
MPPAVAAMGPQSRLSHRSHMSGEPRESEPRHSASRGARSLDHEIRTDLRAASDGILTMIESLRQIEATKREFRPGTPEFLWYAERVEELSHTILGLSTREKKVAQLADAQPGASPMTVEETPPPSIPELLERWRLAERRLATAGAQSPDQAELEQEVDRARHLYRLAIEKAGDSGTG